VLCASTTVASTGGSGSCVLDGPYRCA
jgi:hypothetical protein